MKSFTTTAVKQNPEVIKAEKAILELQKLINSVENENKQLDTLIAETSEKHQTALADFGLGKITKDEFAKIEFDMKEAQGKKHKFNGDNNGVVQANRKKALEKLEAELQAAKDYAAQSIVSEGADFVDSTRSELVEPIAKIKSTIKELSEVLNSMKINSPQATLPFKYDFALRNLAKTYNCLTVLENIGTDNLDNEFIAVYDDTKRFLDR